MNAQAPQVQIPPMPPVEHYGQAIARFALGAMRRAAPVNPDLPRIVVYLAPWYRQAAAWFAVAFSIAAAARTGAQVEFLINDLPYPSIHPHELDEIAALDAFCREFEAMFPACRLSAYAAMPASDRVPIIDRVVNEALRLDLRHRSGNGTVARSHRSSFALSARTPLTHVATACDRFLATERPDVLFCPGGAANGSYVIRQLADVHGIRFASADSSFGLLVLGAHSIAGHLIENAEAVIHVASLDASFAATARERAVAALARKVEKAKAYTAPLPPCDLLLPLGYDYDTVALGVGSLYTTQDDWMRETVDFMARVHPNAHVVVRQHPEEAAAPSPENVALLAELDARRLPTLRTMRASERIPVYGLLQKAKVCVACQSTVVLEAQMLGLPTVSMRDTYYVAAGAITRPQSKEAYFNWLDACLRGAANTITQETRDAAALSYFVLEECVAEATKFTPHAADLWTWLHGDPQADLRSENFADAIRAIVADISFATLKARRILGLPPLPEGVSDPIAA